MSEKTLLASVVLFNAQVKSQRAMLGTPNYMSLLGINDWREIGG
jgi:hypothetical protein